jgi:GT2 family glycosyltransferase
MRFAGRRDTINSAGIEVDGLGVASDRLLGRPIEDSEDAPTEVFGACAGAAVYSRAMLEDTGGFDTSFYVYLEDVDLAWRARMHGWRTLYVPGAVVYHHHSATMEHASPRKYFLVGRNRVRLLAKNATASHLLRASIPMLLYDAAYVVAVGARSRTLAPLHGRLAGLREWRRYRHAGRNDRRPVQLASRRAFRDAFERDRAWRRRNRPR